MNIHVIHMNYELLYPPLDHYCVQRDDQHPGMSSQSDIVII